MWSWLAERLPLREVEAAIQHKTVPLHQYSLWYFLGGMALFFFIVQALAERTGRQVRAMPC